MTIFRQAAARRGVVIAAIGPAKVKTAFQLVWQGGAYLWFAMATAALLDHWEGSLWHGLALFVGTAGTILMSRGNLAAWIVDPHGIKPGVNMPLTKLAPDELEALITYLMGLQ